MKFRILLLVALLLLLAGAALAKPSPVCFGAPGGCPAPVASPTLPPGKLDFQVTRRPPRFNGLESVR